MHGLVSETSICYWQGQPENYLSLSLSAREKGDDSAEGGGGGGRRRGSPRPRGGSRARGVGGGRLPGLAGPIGPYYRTVRRASRHVSSDPAGGRDGPRGAGLLSSLSLRGFFSESRERRSPFESVFHLSPYLSVSSVSGRSAEEAGIGDGGRRVPGGLRERGGSGGRSPGLAGRPVPSYGDRLATSRRIPRGRDGGPRRLLSSPRGFS
jgi:hypothetical protein